MNEHSIPISYRDGVTNELFGYQVADASASIFIVLPAMGVWASYYQPFLQELAEQGFHAFTVDLRGNGKSSIRPSRKIDFGYQTLVDDLGEILATARQTYPNSKIYLIGHSLGGQVACLHSGRYPESVDGLILIAACAVYHKGWGSSFSRKLRMFGRIFPLISSLFGYFPGKKVGFGGREARTVMSDWCHNALTGRYELKGSDFDYEAAMRTHQPNLMAIAIKDDWMAPMKAVKYLTTKFDSDTSIIYKEIGGEETGVPELNHFNWAKNPKYFVRLVGEWVKS